MLPKVLFLPKYPRAIASSRYRIYQYLDCFRDKLDFEVSSFYSEYSYGVINSRTLALKKILVFLKELIRRSSYLVVVNRYDYVYLQREFIPGFSGHLLRLMMSFSTTKLILDIDDALFIQKDNPNVFLKLDKAERMKRLIRNAHIVSAGNPWLAKESIALGAERAIFTDIAEVPVVNSFGTKSFLDVIWLGSPSTSKYLLIILEALEEVNRLVPFKLHIVGGKNLPQNSLHVCYHAWSEQGEKELLEKCGVGLMPLPDDNWSNGKCGGKARTYMANLVVPVVSGVGFNRELIEHGKNGYLCSSIIDWQENLIAALTDTDRSRAICRKNQDFILANNSREKIALQLLNIFENE